MFTNINNTKIKFDLYTKENCVYGFMSMKTTNK